MLPKDPMMLLSVVNLKLRDFYDSLESMCDDMDIPTEDVVVPLEKAGFCYDATRNQFI